jgi:hypothetical protein
MNAVPCSGGNNIPQINNHHPEHIVQGVRAPYIPQAQQDTRSHYAQMQAIRQAQMQQQQ